jgi:hypothetical protein
MRTWREKYRRMRRKSWMEGCRVRQGRLPRQEKERIELPRQEKERSELPRQEKEMMELPRQEFVGRQQDGLAV